MGLCFDYRVMSDDRGFFFIPGVDIGCEGCRAAPTITPWRVMCRYTNLYGLHRKTLAATAPPLAPRLVYSPLQTAVMTAKLPASMHRDVIVFNSKRWVAPELLQKVTCSIFGPSSPETSLALYLPKGNLTLPASAWHRSCASKGQTPRT